MVVSIAPLNQVELKHMKCAHCHHQVHAAWNTQHVYGSARPLSAQYRAMICPNCLRELVEIRESDDTDWYSVLPMFVDRDIDLTYVPKELSEDFTEAAAILTISAKASAALSRRCLQAILDDKGYTGRNLSMQIDALLNEQDASKAISSSLRATVDAVRQFGNFSAHPIDDQTSLQVIAVEPHEAEWCLEILEEMFDHFYTRPALVAQRKAALDAKLAAAGKPPSKT